MTDEELKCIGSINIEQAECSKNCQGMNVVSYSIQELEPKWTKGLVGPNTIMKMKFLNDRKKTKFISKLSDQYNNYKKSYNFPTKFKRKLYTFLLINLKFSPRIQVFIQTSLHQDLL